MKTKRKLTATQLVDHGFSRSMIDRLKREGLLEFDMQPSERGGRQRCCYSLAEVRAARKQSKQNKEDVKTARREMARAKREEKRVKPIGHGWSGTGEQSPVSVSVEIDPERKAAAEREKIWPKRGTFFEQLQRANDAAHKRESAARRGES